MRHLILRAPPSATTALLPAMLAASVITACGGEDPSGPPAERVGSVEVTTSTSGGSLDADGYAVPVARGAARAIGLNATVTVSDVDQGAQGVELTGVAANCTVAGENPRSVTVTAGATAATRFEVACAPVGSIEVSTATTGGGLDPDGYGVSVAGGAPQAIGLDASLELAGIPAGPQNVELSGVAANCSVAGENPREVAVVADSTAGTRFDVACVPPVRYVDAATGDDQGGANACQDAAAPCATISHVIEMAAEGDTIAIADGTYTESLMVDKSLTLDGESEAGTIIQAHEQPEQASERVITIMGALVVEIAHLTIRHGVASVRPAFQGGGIHSAGAALTLSHVTFSENDAQRVRGFTSRTARLR